jgi:hypothetical protein
MREIRTSGLMSGDGRRSDAKWLSYRAHPRLYRVVFGTVAAGLLFASVVPGELRREPTRVPANWRLVKPAKNRFVTSRQVRTISNVLDTV